MTRPWKHRLLDIAYAVRRIRHWTEGMDRKTFFRDLKTLEAVLRELEVIGEAARHIPDDVAHQVFPGIPWNEIRGFRNVAAHEYFRIDPERVWEIVSADVPRLENQILPRVREMFPGVDLDRAPLQRLFPTDIGSGEPPAGFGGAPVGFDSSRD